MAEAGIDTTKFKAHSIRAAATTAAITAGASKDQAAHGKWRSTGTMDRFYNRARGKSAAQATKAVDARKGVTGRILAAKATTRAAAARKAGPIGSPAK